MPRGIIKIYDRVASIGSPVFCMIIIDTLGKCRKSPQKSGAIPLHPAGRIKDIVQLAQTLMELSKVFLKVIYSHEKETEGAGGTPSQSQQIFIQHILTHSEFSAPDSNVTGESRGYPSPAEDAGKAGTHR